MKREQAFVATLRREIQAGTCTKLGLAKKAGISRSHLDKILAGGCRLSLELADTLADAIGQPLEEMIADKSNQREAVAV
jgi:transcriptional regulator with XRE-family HTH domain